MTEDVIIFFYLKFVKMASKKNNPKDIENQKKEMTQEENEQSTQESVEEVIAEQEEKDINEVDELGVKLQEMSDKYLRLTAEFDNYRRRTLKEKMELTKTAGENLLVKILPVIDNFERAIQSMEQTEDVTAVRDGILLIYHDFKKFLEQNGVAEIEAINKEFDTDLHEAITKVPAPEEAMKGKVVDCIEKGYKLNDKVMRFSKVVVGE